MDNFLESGRKNFALLLIENGADVNSGDNEGWTPIQHAASRGN